MAKKKRLEDYMPHSDNVTLFKKGKKGFFNSYKYVKLNVKLTDSLITWDKFHELIDSYKISYDSMNSDRGYEEGYVGGNWTKTYNCDTKSYEGEINRADYSISLEKYDETGNEYIYFLVKDYYHSNLDISSIIPFFKVIKDYVSAERSLQKIKNGGENLLANSRAELTDKLLLEQNNSKSED